MSKWSPGSEQARKYGCVCAPDSFEERADGTRGYWVNMACPLHRPEEHFTRQNVTAELVTSVVDEACHGGARCITGDKATRCKHCPMPPEDAMPRTYRSRKRTLIAAVMLATMMAMILPTPKDGDGDEVLWFSVPAVAQTI